MAAPPDGCQAAASRGLSGPASQHTANAAHPSGHVRQRADESRRWGVCGRQVQYRGLRRAGLLCSSCARVVAVLDATVGGVGGVGACACRVVGRASAYCPAALQAQPARNTWQPAAARDEEVPMGVLRGAEVVGEECDRREVERLAPEQLHPLRMPLEQRRLQEEQQDRQHQVHEHGHPAQRAVEQQLGEVERAYASVPGSFRAQPLDR
mmetsp:Transcript_16166/g.41845  ORF Transcript_16166/g.41845 Transcript_16166/m.41845 type:complete len:209 (-) Transcript_16166:302-928(-)